MENKVINGIKAHFKPEVVNRIGNNIVVFDFIRDEVSQLIVKSQIKKINENIKRLKKIDIEISQETLEYYYKLSKEKNVLEMGGRGIGNMIEEKYINELSNYIFDSRNEKGKIIIYVENEKIQDIPIHLRKVGAKQYKYPHDYENNFVKQKYMNETILVFYTVLMMINL